MQLPFTVEEFYRVFREYNEALWPAQVFLVGLALAAIALVVYPLWSWYAGHGFPFLPTFGLPCPTTIYTIGLLAFLVRPYPRSPFVVPLLWCLVGAQAAFLLGVPQDMGLIAAGVVGVVLLLRSKPSAVSVRVAS